MVSNKLTNVELSLTKRQPWYVLNSQLAIGLPTVLFFILLALLADFIAPYNPLRSIGEALTPPSQAHWFGTDDIGRDILSGVLYGARTSLIVGLSVATSSFVIGTFIGSISGYAGGWVDDLLMRLTELVMLMPRFFLALVVVALFGSSLRNLIFVLALTNWGFMSRLTRAGVLSVKETDYVIAARSMGMREWRVLFKHVLPNILAPVITYATLQVGSAILLEAGLSFLGLGDPNVISWGYMLNIAQAFMRRAWWMAVFPGTGIALFVLGINLLGDGLNLLWNPLYRR